MMAKKSRTTRELADVQAARDKSRARHVARKDSEARVAAIGNKKFDTMTRAEKDELLFKLCLEAGILPKETE